MLDLFHRSCLLNAIGCLQRKPSGPTILLKPYASKRILQQVRGERASGPQDHITVVGYCRGDELGQSPELCNLCLKNISAIVLDKCPTEKEAIIWEETCTLQYSNDSRFHLMGQEPLQMLESPHNYSTYVGSETYNGGLQLLLDKLIQKASSSAALYASGSINITGSKDIYSLVQCMPSLSPKECSDCLHDSSSKIPGSCCGGAEGGRVLKSSCTLRYESILFYTNTGQTVNQQYLTAADPPKPSVHPNNPSADHPKHSKGIKKIVIAVVSTVIGVVILIISIGIFFKTRKNKSKREKLLEKKIGTVEPSQFDFNEIRLAIEDFSDKNRLGQGGFGPVYKGRYNGQDIAVKSLSKTSQQGDLEFKNEVKLVANLQHRNLVRLLGFCLDKMERLVIYEYILNSSLDKFIFG